MDDKKNLNNLEKETQETIVEIQREKNIKNLILIKTKEYDFYKLQNIIDYTILVSEKQINLKNIYKQKKNNCKRFKKLFFTRMY